jgi:hypothetical protein
MSSLHPETTSQDFEALLALLGIAARLHEAEHGLATSTVVSSTITSGFLGYAKAAATTTTPVIKPARVAPTEPDLRAGKLYCWSCGVDCRHPSAMCSGHWRKAGHKDAATASAKLGGHTRPQAETILHHWRTKKGWTD